MFIVEPVPAGELQGSVVLHVRAHCRDVVRKWKRSDPRSDAIEALGLLFGITVKRARELRLDAALDESDPLLAAAERIAEATGVQEVPLGHDDEAVALCMKWLERRVAAERVFDHMFASDPETLLVFSEAMDLATAHTPDGKPVPIMICGNTGTGKEMLARAIHALSVRERAVAKDKFVPVLIDEAGDLSPEAQLRLLRTVQDGVVERTGATTQTQVEVRILAATNRDIDAEVEKQTFRLDLLHRLRRGWLVLPPLRARTGWQHEVVNRMLGELGYRYETALVRSARDALTCHHWPGNLRELRGVLEIAAANAAGEAVRVEHLPRWLQRKYLNAPLHVRAAGSLSDDLVQSDSQQIAGRVERLREEIESKVEAVPDETLEAIVEFHASIPDRSVEHATTVERLRTLQTMVNEASLLKGRSRVWAAVRGQGLAEEVDAAVQAEVHALASKISEADGAIEAHLKAIDLVNDPWWKLVHELGGLPIFDDETRPHIQAVIVWVSRLVTSVAPEFADDLFARIRQGGLNAVRTGLRELMEYADEDGEPDRIDPSSLSEKDWRDLRHECGTRAEAARVLGCDTKTVTKYATEALGSDPWSRETKRKAPTPKRVSGGPR